MRKNIHKPSQAIARRGAAAPPGAGMRRRSELGEHLTAEFRGLFREVINHRQRAFLSGYVQSCGIRSAARLSGLSRQSHYEWMRDDPLYREHFRRAKEIIADAVEEEVHRRARLGYETPIIYRGKITGYYQSYSDQLLTLLVKAVRPEIYRESARPQFDIGGPTEINIRVNRPEKNSAEPGAEDDGAPKRISIPHPDGGE